MDELRWRAKLSRLDLQRNCSALASEDSCWLCESLEEWNAVLGALRLILIEYIQGKICLRSPYGRPPISLNGKAALFSTAFFIAWLPRKHHCIQALDLSEGHPRLRVAAIPDFIARSPTNLRYISFGGLERGDTSFDWARLLDSLGSTEHLEQLELMHLAISDSLASKLNQLLLTNASCLQALTVYNTSIDLGASDILMSGIPRFEALTHLAFDVNADSPGLKNLARLLRGTGTLQQLCMTEQAVGNGGAGAELTNPGSDEEVVAVVCDLLRKNATPTEFFYQAKGQFFTGILKALESNDVLRKLTLSCYGFEPLYTGTVVGAELRSMLSKNRGLRSLTLGNCVIDHDCAVLISAGLRQNSTLECLDLSPNQSSYTAVYDLCNSLTVNNACFLKIGSFAACRNQRMALVKLLVLNELYGRLAIPWLGIDAPGLAVSLLYNLPRPRDILLDTTQLCDAGFSLLCRMLSRNDYVTSLTVYLCRPSSDKILKLRMLLETNTSFRCVTIEVHQSSLSDVMEAVLGLRGNESVTQLEIRCTEMDAVSCQQVAQLLAENGSLSTVTLAFERHLSQASVDAISRGLLRNRFITTFLIESPLSAGCCVASLEAAVVRNTTCLHRAVRFALGLNTGKVCAEAFELLETKASLVNGIMLASGWTETEARQVVRSARQFIKSNYLFINGIVRSRIECNAGEEPQIEVLNFECWRAIASYLKVSDVIDRK